MILRSNKYVSYPLVARATRGRRKVMVNDDIVPYFIYNPQFDTKLLCNKFLIILSIKAPVCHVMSFLPMYIINYYTAEC